MSAIDLDEPRRDDPYDVRRARHAPGLLRAFNDAGVLAAADVHVAVRARGARRRDRRGGRARGRARRPRAAPRARLRRPGRRSATPRPSNPTSPSTSALYLGLRSRVGSRARGEPARRGRGGRGREPPAAARRHLRSTSTATGARNARSPPTCARSAARETDRRSRARRDGLDAPVRAAAAAPDTRQRAAAATAPCGGASPVVAGGPGTGKTTTVARIVALLAEQAAAAGAPAPLVALAAPTGKAAARLEEAVHAEAARLDVAPSVRDALLGAQRVDAAPAARLAPGQPQPLPPQPRQPAPARRRDRRRDLDGLAVADGAAGRGGAAGGAARAGRRPGPADVDRGRRGARRHRPRRGAGRRRARARLPLRRRGSTRSPPRSAAATATR